MKLLIFLTLLQLVVVNTETWKRQVREDPMFLSGSDPTQHLKAHITSTPWPDLDRLLAVNEDEDNGLIGLKVPSESSASIATSTVIPLVSVLTETTASGTVQILPSATSRHPDIEEHLTYSLDMSGHTTKPPLIENSIPIPSKTLAPASVTIQDDLPQTILISQDIFQPVATSAPPSIFSTRSDHPVTRQGIESQGEPLATNKFYSNFYLGNQTARTWTQPYSLGWVRGDNKSGSWGMSIVHIDANQKFFGPDARANPVKYYFNPLGLLSLIISSSELGSSTTLTIDSLTSMSANVNLHPSPDLPAQMSFPLVQGMGFVTVKFHSGTPVLESTIYFRNFTKLSKAPKSGISKFKIDLEDDNTWLLYAYSPLGANLEFTIVSKKLARATSQFNGIIQIAKNPSSSVRAEKIYDEASGAFATSVKISGSVNNDSGSYTFSFIKEGMANTTLAMFALPHHVSSFSPQTLEKATDLQLETTTKGKATIIISDTWTMIENLPTSLGFKPWSPEFKNEKNLLSPETVNSIRKVANVEISQDMKNQTNLDSIYYSGKALAKFAGIAYTLQELLGDKAMAQAGLNELKECFALFTSNRNKYPLVYEKAWKGIVSSASYVTGDPGIDFGNTYYNDHHFHYGYFILAAAMIGSIDSNWVKSNKDYINTLVRDIANPSSLDPYFPVSRNFDWYHGHSWAHGLFESFDGKNQESSSEDSMSAYALKMWGHVTGDSNMEARGNLQLAVNARSIQKYYLYENSNSIQPSNFTGNKVAGILFENKIDYTTFFGSNCEYIHGIHMIPLLASSSLTRTRTFVQEEWDSFFSNGRVDTFSSGWRGIFYANQAIIEPKAAWRFFNSANFNESFLDGGASRTWYMALAAGLGGN